MLTTIDSMLTEARQKKQLQEISIKVFRLLKRFAVNGMILLPNNVVYDIRVELCIAPVQFRKALSYLIKENKIVKIDRSIYELP